jgi:hypothetical protein
MTAGAALSSNRAPMMEIPVTMQIYSCFVYCLVLIRLFLVCAVFDYKFHWDGFDDFKMIVPPTESVMPVLDLTATDAPQAADVMVDAPRS